MFAWDVAPAVDAALVQIESAWSTYDHLRGGAIRGKF
jgi:hypothetical protein